MEIDSELRSKDTWLISEDGLWHDFRSEEGGDLIDLISQVNNISKKEAAETIIKIDDGIVPDKVDKKKVILPKYWIFDPTDTPFRKRLKAYALIVGDGGLVNHFFGLEDIIDPSVWSTPDAIRWSESMWAIEPIHYIGNSLPAALLLRLTTIMLKPTAQKVLS